VILACLTIALAQTQPSNIGDCYQMDLDDCIGTNPEPGHPLNNGMIHCLWCHSHHNGTQAHSHCAPLEHVVTKYEPGWICDYRMPSNRREALMGAVQARQKHPGRHLLAAKDQATGMTGVELWAATEVSTWPSMVQFIAGVVWGATGKIPGDINQCLTFSDETFDELNATFASIVWPPTGITSAYEDVAALFKGVGDALTSVAFASAAIDCTDVGIDVAEMIMPIASQAMGLTGPILSLVTASISGNPIGIASGIIGIIKWGVDLGTELVSKLSVNFEPDFDAAVTAAKSDNWFEAGVHIGNLIYVLAFTG